MAHSLGRDRIGRTLLPMLGVAGQTCPLRATRCSIQCRRTHQHWGSLPPVLTRIILAHMCGHAAPPVAPPYILPISFASAYATWWRPPAHLSTLGCLPLGLLLLFQLGERDGGMQGLVDVCVHMRVLHSARMAGSARE